MFRPLYGHHQAYHLNHVIKTLRTLLGSQLCLQNFEMTFCKHNWDPSNVRRVLMT